MNFSMSSDVLPELHEQGIRIRFTAMMNIMKIFAVLISVAESLLFGWIIKKLISADIKAEFVR